MKKCLMRLIQLLFIIIALPAFAAEDTYPFTSAKDAQRFSSLTQEIRCVVCQNQNIADSNAPLANDLRNKVYQMIVAKQSDLDIKNYLVKRYGEFILLEPRFSKFTVLLWLFPCLGLVGFLFFFTRYLRQQTT